MKRLKSSAIDFFQNKKNKKIGEIKIMEVEKKRKKPADAILSWQNLVYMKCFAYR